MIRDIKWLVLLSFLTIPLFVFSQNPYETDSIFKANKVKLQKLYRDGKLIVISHYNKNGQITKKEVLPDADYQLCITNYQYNDENVLVKKVDTIRNLKLDKKALRKEGYTKRDIRKLCRRPKIQIAKYDIEHENNMVSKITKYNVDKTLDHIYFYEDHGKKITREHYENNKIKSKNVTYFRENFFKSKEESWRINERNEKTERFDTYDYKIDGGEIKEIINLGDDRKLNAFTYYYNDKKLLIKSIEFYDFTYEYEYYK